MVVEGAIVAVYGRRYIDFMERQGLLDLGKRLIRKLDIRSPVVFAGIGAAEAVWGVVLLRRAQAMSADENDTHRLVA